MANFESHKTYTDLDGMSRSFTFVDHDTKTKISLNRNTPFNVEWDFLYKLAEDYKEIRDKFLQENSTELEYINLAQLRKIRDLISEINNFVD